MLVTVIIYANVFHGALLPLGSDVTINGRLFPALCAPRVQVRLVVVCEVTAHSTPPTVTVVGVAKLLPVIVMASPED